MKNFWIGLFYALMSVIALKVLVEFDYFKPQYEQVITFDQFKEKEGIEYVRISHLNGLAYYLDGQNNVVMIIAENKYGVNKLTKHGKITE